MLRECFASLSLVVSFVAWGCNGAGYYYLQATDTLTFTNDQKIFLTDGTVSSGVYTFGVAYSYFVKRLTKPTGDFTDAAANVASGKNSMTPR